MINNGLYEKKDQVSYVLISVFLTIGLSCILDAISSYIFIYMTDFYFYLLQILNEDFSIQSSLKQHDKVQ